MTTFLEVWRDMGPEAKKKLAIRVDSTIPYLSQLAHGHRGPSRKMLRRLLAADRRIKAEMFL